MLNEKKKTVGRSFRIDEEWLRVLNEEAKKQDISVNALLNRLLQKYAYLRFMLRYGAVTITSKGFAAILESCPEDKVRENGRNAGTNIARDVLMTMGVKPNYDLVILIITKLLSEFAGWFKCDYHVKQDKDILHLRHDLGVNWSIYVSEVANAAFTTVLKKEVLIEHSDYSVTVTITKQSKNGIIHT